MNFFLTAIKNTTGYPKIRNLQKLLSPRLSLVKINAILRYLEKSKQLEIDLDGNIIWIREDSVSRPSLGEVANISKDVLEYFSIRGVHTEDDS